MNPNRSPFAVPLVEGFRQRVRAVEIGIAVAAEDEQALAAGEADEVVEQAERRLVGPLEVVDEEDETGGVGEVDEQTGDTIEEAEAELGGGELGWRRPVSVRPC